MKKIITFLISAALTVTTAISSMPASAFAAEDEVLTQEEFIEESDNYVEVSDEGLIEFNIPDELVEQISEEEYNVYLEAIDKINQLIEDGELSVTDAGSIYESDNEELVIQGGNVDCVEWHWWGVRRYANHNNASTIARNLSRCSATAGYVSCVGVALGYVLPSATAKAVAAVVAIGATFAWAYYGHVASEISYYNGSRGVIIDVTWVLYFDVCSQ